MANKYINIRFPFQLSPQGFLLDLTKTNNDAIKSDLMHLILTRKGERLYAPSFGTNLLKFIFEPNDKVALSLIKTEIKDTVKKFIPNLVINEVSVTNNEEAEYTATVRIDYTITEDVFESTDFIIINV